MYDTTHIKNYILYLKNKCSLSVSLHPNGAEKLITPSELMTFNIHDNSYCIYVKTDPEAHLRCFKNQYDVRKKCKGGSFTGTCHAGVCEYVYPIEKAGRVLGFISVSAYKTKDAQSYISRTAEKFSLSPSELCSAYATLKDEMPPKEVVDTLIYPLADMLELAYIKIENESEANEDQIGRIERYIKQHRARNISLEDVCLEFSCSRSSISHLFKKKTGKSFREYLTDVRIEDAKSLLAYSSVSVSEIASSCGFSDANYFSGVFKRTVGMSPMVYRDRNRVKKNKK